MIRHENNDFFGKQLCISVYGCNDNIHSIPFWQQWFPRLIDLINMKAHGPLHIDEFGEGDLFGISAMQFIETSSIILHNERRNNGIHLDVFSCADFNEYKVMDYIYETLHPDMKTTNFKILYR